MLSHDEVVHGKRSLLSKMPGDVWQKFANLRMFYAWMFGHPGKKLLFMGGEFGQWREWNHDASLDWGLLQSPLHDGVHHLVQHLNYLYKSDPALWDVDDAYEGLILILISTMPKTALLRGCGNPVRARSSYFS